jgi:hypothetical protein
MCKGMSLDTLKLLKYEALMADDIVIDDYNSDNNSGSFVGISVEIDGGIEPNFSNSAQRPSLELNFVDKYNNHRKLYS